MLLERGQPLDAAERRPHHRHGEGRRAPVRGAHRRGAPVGPGPHGAAQDQRPEALRRRHRAATSSPSASAPPAPASPTWPWPWPCRRCRPSRSTASSSPGPRSRRASGSGFLPGDLMAKVDPYLRPLYDALYDMLDAEGAQRLLEREHHRGRAAGLHARPHAQRQLHHPRRGAEHHARADEDVPHPHRVRLQGRRHRRRHPGRPGRRRSPACSASSRSSPASTASRSCASTSARRRAPPHRAGHRRRLRAGAVRRR